MVRTISETREDRYDLSWVGTKVKLAQKGLCPFCGSEVVINEPHKCGFLRDRTNVDNETEILKNDFDDSSLLVGLSWRIIEVANRIFKKYDNIKLYLIYPAAE